ncbi:MAG TPA: AAA family ATPase [Rhizomicrobium sp.]|nr:AAA family ATPase [Rhizomicrobium sp.]
MIRRFYIHNFRCLENFELPITGRSSVLLIGRNGAGKTSIGLALEILQKIARGTNRVAALIGPADFPRGATHAPMRLEIEVELGKKLYAYSVALELPERFRELRVLEEKLSVDGKPVYTRELAQVQLARGASDAEAKFLVDWHLIALPIIQHPSKDDPIGSLKRWLASALILRPIPSQIRGDSERETLAPNVQVTDLGGWFWGLSASAPAVYSTIEGYLKQVMPDFLDIQNPPVSTEFRTLIVQFSTISGTIRLGFNDLSDGEKCFIIYAMVIAANQAYGPLLCYWDEPDNYLAPSEVNLSIIALRRTFQDRGQLIVTSHNPDAIRGFADENTLYLYRNSHLEPTMVKSVESLRSSGDLNGSLIDALVRGDLFS